MSKNKYLFLLFAVVILKTIFLVWLLVNGEIGLGPDEAQYWTWSQTPSLGYYSKPPGIAWQIGFGTFLVGNVEWGVRFFSLFIGILLPAAVFRLAEKCGLSLSACFWAGAAMALTPIGILASFLAITDGAMVLFWTLACAELAQAITTKKQPNFYLLGCLILAGALFKWTLFYFWIVVFLSFIFYPFLANKKVVGAIFISLMALLPSFFWNWEHEWVTFRHVFSTVQGNSSGQSILNGNFWAFVGEQAALLSPLLFILLLLASIRLFSDAVPPGIKFCGTIFFGGLSLFALFSLFKKMQGNWCDFIHPCGLVFLSWYACESVKWGKKWLQAGLALSLFLTGFIFSIPYFQSNNIALAGFQIPYKWNPFRHNLGWDRLAFKLDQLGYESGHNFLFGDKYQTSSILSFYNSGQKRAYFLNLHGIRLNQFSFWPGMEEEQVGMTGYFVLPENSPTFSDIERKKYLGLLQDYFKEVELVAIEPLFFSYERPVKSAMIFRCRGYNGKIPEKPRLY